MSSFDVTTAHNSTSNEMTMAMLIFHINFECNCCCCCYCVNRSGLDALSQTHTPFWMLMLFTVLILFFFSDTFPLLLAIVMHKNTITRTQCFRYVILFCCFLRRRRRLFLIVCTLESLANHHQLYRRDRANE